MRAKQYSKLVAGMIGISLIVWSCLPEPLPVKNIDQAKTRIVVSSQIVEDQSLVILLTKSIGALDASDESAPEDLIAQIAVDDAVVTVTGAGRTDTLLALTSGFYGAIDIPFVAGETYSLHVNSESLGEVSATTVAKAYVGFESVHASLYYNGYDTTAEVNYSLKDPKGKNWYMISAQHVSGKDLQERLINPRVHIQLLDDEKFEGLTYGEKIRVLSRDFAPGDSLLVLLSNINKDYYDFMQLRVDGRFSFVDFISEPINYPTNVQGGLGFFNLYIPDTELFVLEE